MGDKNYLHRNLNIENIMIHNRHFKISCCEQGIISLHNSEVYQLRLNAHLYNPLYFLIII